MAGSAFRYSRPARNFVQRNGWPTHPCPQSLKHRQESEPHTRGPPHLLAFFIVIISDSVLVFDLLVNVGFYFILLLEIDL